MCTVEFQSLVLSQRCRAEKLSNRVVKLTAMCCQLQLCKSINKDSDTIVRVKDTNAMCI